MHPKNFYIKQLENKKRENLNMVINIKQLLEYNKMRAKQSLEENDIEHYNKCQGWVDALEYVIRNYNIIEKEV